MPKKELLESAFADAFENEWNNVEEVPFEPSADFKSRMAELMAKTNEENNVDKNTDNTESSDGNGPVVFRFGYIKRMLVAAAVMVLISIVSVVTVAGTGEGYTFILENTPYGLKIGSVIGAEHGDVDQTQPKSIDSETDDAATDNNCLSNDGTDSENEVNNDDHSDIELGPESDFDRSSDSDCANYLISDADKACDSDISANASIEKINRRFEPMVPDSYKKTYTFANEDVYMVEYETPSGSLSYSQRIMSVDDYIDDSTYWWDTMDVEVSGETIKYLYCMSYKGQTTAIIWNRYGYSFMMMAEDSDSDSVMHMVQLSENLLPVD